MQELILFKRGTQDTELEYVLFSPELNYGATAETIDELMEKCDFIKKLFAVETRTGVRVTYSGYREYPCVATELEYFVKEYRKKK